MQPSHPKFKMVLPLHMELGSFFMDSLQCSAENLLSPPVPTRNGPARSTFSKQAFTLTADDQVRL